MRICVEPYTESFVPAMKSFNARLAARGVPYQLGEDPGPWDCQSPRPIIHRSHFVAVEDGEVRGGFMLQHQPFWVGGALRDVGNYQTPVSEGVLDRKYACVGMLLLKHAMRESPLLFGAGGGGFDQPLPRLLKAMGWALRKVPFLFRVHRPRRFLKEVRLLRRNPLLRLAADVAGMTGAGSLGIRLLQAHAPTGAPPPAAVRMEAVGTWAGWADDLWEENTGSHSMAGLRTSATLTLLYPPDDPRYLCYRVRHDARTVGWMVLLNTAMRSHPHFGDLQVGTVLDCLALPGYRDAVARAATRQLEDDGVDLLVTNQAHHAWVDAFRRAGFLTGPSNYVLAMSKQLTDLLEPLAQREHQIHITRGDADGRNQL